MQCLMTLQSLRWIWLTDPSSVVCKMHHFNANTYTHLTALCPGLPRWAGTRKVKTNLDFTEAKDSEWQWHQLGDMQVCTSLPADNHARTPPLSFLQARCPSCRPTNSVKALKACITSMLIITKYRLWPFWSSVDAATTDGVGPSNTTLITTAY